MLVMCCHFSANHFSYNFFRFTALIHFFNRTSCRCRSHFLNLDRLYILITTDYYCDKAFHIDDSQSFMTNFVEKPLITLNWNNICHITAHETMYFLCTLDRICAHQFIAFLDKPRNQYNHQCFTDAFPIPFSWLFLSSHFGELFSYLE